MTVLFGSGAMRTYGKFDIIGQQPKDFGVGMDHAGVE